MRSPSAQPLSPPAPHSWLALPGDSVPLSALTSASLKWKHSQHKLRHSQERVCALSGQDPAQSQGGDRADPGPGTKAREEKPRRPLAALPMLSSIAEQNLRQLRACGFKREGFCMGGGRFEQKLGLPGLRGQCCAQRKEKKSRRSDAIRVPWKESPGRRQIQTVSGRRYKWENQSAWRH